MSAAEDKIPFSEREKAMVAHIVALEEAHSETLRYWRQSTKKAMKLQRQRDSLVRKLVWRRSKGRFLDLIATLSVVPLLLNQHWKGGK